MRDENEGSIESETLDDGNDRPGKATLTSGSDETGGVREESYEIRRLRKVIPICGLSASACTRAARLAISGPSVETRRAMWKRGILWVGFAIRRRAV